MFISTIIGRLSKIFSANIKKDKFIFIQKTPKRGSSSNILMSTENYLHRTANPQMGMNQSESRIMI